MQPVEHVLLLQVPAPMQPVEQVLLLQASVLPFDYVLLEQETMQQEEEALTMIPPLCVAWFSDPASLLLRQLLSL